MFHHQQPLVNYHSHFNNKHSSSGKTRETTAGFPQFPVVPTSPTAAAATTQQPPLPEVKGAVAAAMRLRGEPQVFVSVAYDFEYLAEDGKRVFMKENEILLLINKTNHDWWQVSPVPI